MELYDLTPPPFIPITADELDSFMFQTVGHEGISLYAEALGLPLYRSRTRGCSVAMGMEYHPSEGDEVEDLYQLLKRVKVGHNFCRTRIYSCSTWYYCINYTIYIGKRICIAIAVFTSHWDM